MALLVAASALVRRPHAGRRQRRGQRWGRSAKGGAGAGPDPEEGRPARGGPGAEPNLPRWGAGRPPYPGAKPGLTGGLRREPQSEALMVRDRAELALGPPCHAEIQRRSIWDMPKNIEQYMKSENRVRYVGKEGIAQTRKLVCLKGKGLQKYLQRSGAKLGNSMVSRRKLVVQYRTTVGQHWGRDMPSQWNRDGRRAFRMRSGMQDKRYTTVLKNEDRVGRMPDHQRKRRGTWKMKRRWRWSGGMKGRRTKGTDPG